jgi:hypothetical protein
VPSAIPTNVVLGANLIAPATILISGEKHV